MAIWARRPRPKIRRTGPGLPGLTGRGVASYRIARFATDFGQLLDHLGVEQADVLGWSMGVSVLRSYMDSHGTGRLRKFVAVDGLLELAGKIFGPGGDKVTEGFVRSRFSGEPAPRV